MYVHIVPTEGVGGDTENERTGGYERQSPPSGFIPMTIRPWKQQMANHGTTDDFSNSFDTL
jgi:hypothetical protein